MALRPAIMAKRQATLFSSWQSQIYLKHSYSIVYYKRDLITSIFLLHILITNLDLHPTHFYLPVSVPDLSQNEPVRLLNFPRGISTRLHHCPPPFILEVSACPQAHFLYTALDTFHLLSLLYYQ